VVAPRISERHNASVFKSRGVKATTNYRLAVHSHRCENLRSSDLSVLTTFSCDHTRSNVAHLHISRTFLVRVRRRVVCNVRRSERASLSGTIPFSAYRCLASGKDKTKHLYLLTSHYVRSQLEHTESLV
jgi:hypothetical protein